MSETIAIRPGGVEYVKWPVSGLPDGVAVEVSLDLGLSWHACELVDGGTQARALVASPTAPSRVGAVVAAVGLLVPWLRAATFPEIIIRDVGLIDVWGPPELVMPERLPGTPGGAALLNGDGVPVDADGNRMASAAAVEAVTAALGDETQAREDLAASLPSTYVAQPGVSTKTRVLIVGSSNALGSNATNGNSWAALVAARLSATHEFVNAAVSGKSAATWVTPGANGRTELDDAINTHRPHIVICGFTTQNSGGPSATFISYVERAKAVCDAHRVRMVAVTPYISEDFTAANRDDNLMICEAIKSRDIPALNFDSIWGYLATIPDAIDSGDGLHLNDVGHLEQSRQVPTDMLSLTSECRPITLPSKGGVVIPGTIPDGGAEAITVNTMPAGSFTIGFNLKLPASPGKGAVVALAFVGINGNTRLRLPSSTTLDTAGAFVHSAQSVAFDTEYHVALSFNAITLESKLYLNGVVVSTCTVPPFQLFTRFALGSRETGATAASNACTGYTFRNLTVHATALHPRDVARLAAGRVPLASLQLAAPLTDGAGRPAGGRFASTFGQETTVTVNYATA